MTDARLARARQVALTDAELALRELGFRERRPRVWAGTLPRAEGQFCRVRITLPEAFPDVVPEIHLEDVLKQRFAHVDQSEKVCIAPETGILLDASRPAALIRDAIERARRVVSLSEAEHRRDRLREFSAYWPAAGEAAQTLYTICPVPLMVGEIVIGVLTGSPQLWLVARDHEAASEWATRVGRRVSDTRNGFALPLRVAIDPPAYRQRMTIRHFRGLLSASAAPEHIQALEGWLDKKGLPATVVMSQPVPPDDDSVVFAAYLPSPQSSFAKQWQDGHRNGRAPLTRQLTFASGEAIQRWLVQRMDPSFLIRRGGGDAALLLARIAIIGCGAVGSHVVMTLAAAGVGKLHLVDPESLTAANVQRHVLGAADVGRLKVEGLRQLVHAKHPHVDMTIDARNVLDVFGDAAATASLRDCSLVVVASGNETIDLRINQVLSDTVPRVYVWLEALGLSGHCLLTGYRGRPGCYACLFRADPQYGLVNMSAHAAPGQQLQRTFAGCAGVFTPFGIADAQRAAIEASREVIRALHGEAVPELVSWQTSRKDFEDAGGVLSQRGRSFSIGAVQVTPLSDAGCPTCTDWVS